MIEELLRSPASPRPFGGGGLKIGVSAAGSEQTSTPDPGERSGVGGGDRVSLLVGLVNGRLGRLDTTGNVSGRARSMVLFRVRLGLLAGMSLVLTALVAGGLPRAALGLVASMEPVRSFEKVRVVLRGLGPGSIP